jgi:hypothetical protein
MIRLIKYFTGILLIFTVIILSNGLSAQVNCDISINATLPVCPEYTYILSVPLQDNCTYQWKENNTILDEDGNELIVYISEEVTFTVIVTDTLINEDCMSDLTVTTYPLINVTFDQLQLTCTQTFSDNPDDENKTKTAVMKAIAGDEFEADEYSYMWDVSPLQIDPQDSSIVHGLSAYQKYLIDIKDKHGCIKRDTAIPKAYPNPVIEFATDPNPAYIQKPYVTFSYINLSEDSIQVTNHVWDFGDCIDVLPDDPCNNDIATTQDMPVHTYTKTGDYFPTILVYSQYGCDSLYSDTTLTVKPVKLKIPNIFTPNGDGTNDEFVITEAPPEDEGGAKSTRRINNDEFEPINTFYERSELVIFNRQGRTVYQSNNYQNDWDGGKLPDGVYFYVLKCFGHISNDVYKGSVTIFGSGR